MIDLHCHILPGIDDGPATMEESLEMGRRAVADGIEKVVATPHVGEVIHSSDTIRASVEKLNDALRESGVELEVLAGAEPSAQLDMESLKSYTINGSPYVLIEFSYTHLPQNAREIVYKLQLSGLTPIIAHPERILSVWRSPELLLELVEAGSLVQITADSLTGGLGSQVKGCARHLLKKGAVHFLSTDAHSPNLRSPILSAGAQAAARIVGEEEARRLVCTNPAAVVAGEPLGAC